MDVNCPMILGTFLFIPAINLPNSAGVEYPTVSGILIVPAPAEIALSITLYKKRIYNVCKN